jgi:hypothetical protein
MHTPVLRDCNVVYQLLHIESWNKCSFMSVICGDNTDDMFVRKLIVYTVATLYY